MADPDPRTEVCVLMSSDEFGVANADAVLEYGQDLASLARDEPFTIFKIAQTLFKDMGMTLTTNELPSRVIINVQFCNRPGSMRYRGVFHTAVNTLVEAPPELP